MSDGGSAPVGDAGADSTSESVNTSTFAAPTSTDDLRQSIAERYSLTPAGTYASRAGVFASVAVPQRSTPRRREFVSQAYLRDTVGVTVYQPTGYSVSRAPAGAYAIQDQQFSQVMGQTQADPVDSAFGKQGPMLDKKVRDAPKPEDDGRLPQEVDLRRRALHVAKGRKDQYDYDHSED
jgi:hypothetical protein